LSVPAAVLAARAQVLAARAAKTASA